RERLLADELDQVGDRLEKAERAGAVRAVAELHPAEHLSFEPGRVGEGAHHEVDDHEDLDHRDPPDLVRVSHRVTSTWSWRPSASARGMRAVPGARSRAKRARRRREVPFEWTVTSSPSAIVRLRASAGLSSTSRLRFWKASSGVRSTAVPEKSGV